MPRELTVKQQRLLAYLTRKIERAGKAPSLRQTAQELGVSHAAVAQMIKGLEQKGVLRRQGRYGRTLHLFNRAGQRAGVQRWREVPLVGRVTAGLPMYAQQSWEGMIVVDRTLFRGDNLFGLRIKGDSMRAVGILDGDIAICEPRQFARNGEIVVALIDGEEATVKRFFLREDRVELRPENSRYRPMRYGFDQVLIQGKVVGVQRGPEVMNRL